MALDHPDAVEKVAFLDIVPTHHMLNNIKRQWAVDSYHWFFMAQPYDYPEKMIEAYGFERYIRKKLDKKGVGTAGFTPEALAEYIRCCTPENIHAVCEDYRAAVGIDLVHDEADLATKLAMPMLVLWGEKSHVNRSYKPIEAWRERAARRARQDARLRALPGRTSARRNVRRTAQLLQLTGRARQGPARERYALHRRDAGLR